MTTTLKNDESENATPENEWLRFKISKYNLNYGMTFDDFVNFLCSEHGSDMIGERHWISQYALMTDIEDRLLLDYVGKLESLEADWKHICQQIEIPFSPLERKNNTQQKITKLNPIKYTKDTVEKIKVRYRKDFEIFDYSKEYAT